MCITTLSACLPVVLLPVVSGSSDLPSRISVLLLCSFLRCLMWLRSSMFLLEICLLVKWEISPSLSQSWFRGGWVQALFTDYGQFLSRKQHSLSRQWKQLSIFLWPTAPQCFFDILRNLHVSNLPFCISFSIAVIFVFGVMHIDFDLKQKTYITFLV